MRTGPFIDDLPIHNDVFHGEMSGYQGVTSNQPEPHCFRACIHSSIGTQEQNLHQGVFHLPGPAADRTCWEAQIGSNRYICFRVHNHLNLVPSRKLVSIREFISKLWNNRCVRCSEWISPIRFPTIDHPPHSPQSDLVHHEEGDIVGARIFDLARWESLGVGGIEIGKSIETNDVFRITSGSVNHVFLLYLEVAI